MAENEPTAFLSHRFFGYLRGQKYIYYNKMKLSNLHKALIIAALAIVVIACNDMLDDIGVSQLPERDRMSVGVDTLELSARTVAMTDVFARTRRPVLGEYIDPIFGSIKSEFIGGFFLHNGAGFTEGAVIDSVRVLLSYTTFMGDSLAPMRLSVYRANRSLRNLENMTNINPQDYADMSAPLGQRTFTGRNSIFRIETIPVGMGVEEIRVNEIPVMLPIQIGEDFLAEYLRPNRGMMASNDLFNEFFHGLYFTTTFGNSTLIAVNSTSLFVHYHYLDVGGSSTQQDTIRTNALRLNITPEVTQVNTVQTNSAHLLEPNEEFTFIKSPAGVKTEIQFPILQVYNDLQGQVLNLADFTVFAIPDAMEHITVRLNPPTHLLLINSDSLAGFFERRMLPDNRTSFLSDRFDTQTFSYRFSNISAMLNHYMQEFDFDESDYLNYYLIPVEATTVMQGGSPWAPGTPVLSAIHNQMWPTATVLDKRPGSMRLSLIFSDF